jgi:AbrB family looped-hinge helix DNA binding protein
VASLLAVVSGPILPESALDGRTIYRRAEYQKAKKKQIKSQMPECLIYWHTGEINAGTGRMQIMESARVGKRGAIIVPAKLRRQFGIEEGSIVTAEARDDGILIRPAVIVPVERYTPERKAEFMLSNATNAEDYREARKAVRKLGLNPDSIQHHRPK